MTKELAEWICHACALENGGKAQEKISTYREGICDVCCNWTHVTAPKNFKLYKIEAEHNFKYIMKVLADEYAHYVKLEDRNSANLRFNVLHDWHRKMMGYEK